MFWELSDNRRNDPGLNKTICPWFTTTFIMDQSCLSWLAVIEGVGCHGRQRPKSRHSGQLRNYFGAQSLYRDIVATNNYGHWTPVKLSTLTYSKITCPNLETFGDDPTNLNTNLNLAITKIDRTLPSKKYLTNYNLSFYHSFIAYL
jgi:hypothetical protein